MASREGSGRSDLAAGRAEWAAETEAAKALMAERLFLCKAATGASEPGVDLRLCERRDPQREEPAVTDGESFTGKLRDECLNGEIFHSLKEAQTVFEQ